MTEIRPELQARFGNDPDALEWARGHVQKQIDWLDEAAALPQASPEFVRLATWCAGFMRDAFMGNRLTYGAFDAGFAAGAPEQSAKLADPEFPDLVGVVGGPLLPCKVVEFAATMAPTVRVEGRDGSDATYEQAQRYVIRYQPEPTPGEPPGVLVSHERVDRAMEAVRRMVGAFGRRSLTPGEEERYWTIVDVALRADELHRRGRVSTVDAVLAGMPLDDEHRRVLDAYREAHGGAQVGSVPTAAEVNRAVEWWNRLQEAQGG